MGCEITIISFSRSICRGGLVALIGVTGKPYPSYLSCHSHPIRPFRAPPPRGEGCDTRIPSSKKRRRSRHLNPEPNESKVKRGCEEMRIHFFTAPLVIMDFSVSVFTGDGIPLISHRSSILLWNRSDPVFAFRSSRVPVRDLREGHRCFRYLRRCGRCPG